MKYKEDPQAKYIRLSGPIHCIEEVKGGYQARYLPPYVPEPMVFPVRTSFRDAVLDVPGLEKSASYDRETFEAEVTRRHDPER